MVPSHYAIKSTHIFTTEGLVGSSATTLQSLGPDTVAAFACSASGMSTEGWPKIQIPTSGATDLAPLKCRRHRNSKASCSTTKGSRFLTPGTEMQAEMVAKGHISELITLYEMGTVGIRIRIGRRGSSRTLRPILQEQERKEKARTKEPQSGR